MTIATGTPTAFAVPIAGNAGTLAAGWIGAGSFTDGTFVVQNAVDATKQFNLALGGMTTGKTLTLSSGQTTTQTLNVPNIAATDTLATLGIAQTFSAIQTFSAVPVFSAGLGAMSGTTLALSGQLTSTLATGTAPFSITSTTLVPNLYVARSALSDTVTTNANLTGPITSLGNATSVAAQTGTGSTFVMQASPTLTTPNIGAATGTSLSVTGQLTSSVAIGTAPLVVTSTTNVPNLNASSLNGTTASGGGALTMGGFTLTVPATGTAALLGTANVFTAAQTVKMTSGIQGTLVVDNGTTSTPSGVQFSDNGTTKWGVFKDAGNNLQIKDQVNSIIELQFNPGIAGSGYINSPLTLDATNSTTAAMVLSGGLAVAKSLQVGNSGIFGGLVSSSSTGSTNGYIGVTATVSGTYAGAGTLKGMSAVLNYAPSGATTATYTGNYGTISANVPANGGLLIGMTQFGTLGAAATGTYGNLWGNYTTLTNTGAAVLTLGVGYYAESAINSGTGSIGTYAAIQINTQTAATTNYAIRSIGMGLVSFADTTAASSSTAGAFVVGNGTAATSVAIGGGQINAGSSISCASIGTVTGGITSGASFAAYPAATTVGFIRGNSGTFAANSLVLQSGGTTTAGGGIYFGVNNGVSTSTVMQLTATGFGIFGTTPASQATGFGTPTGASRVSSFPGATATLAQCSGQIADIIATLKALGFYGA